MGLRKVYDTIAVLGTWDPDIGIFSGPHKKKSYYNRETMLYTIYPYDGDFNAILTYYAILYSIYYILDIRYYDVFDIIYYI